jgi:hypothetical protein
VRGFYALGVLVEPFLPPPFLPLPPLPFPPEDFLLPPVLFLWLILPPEDFVAPFTSKDVPVVSLVESIGSVFGVTES